MSISVHPWTKRGERRWAVYRREAGKRKYSIFKTRADADAEAARLRLEISQAGKAWLDLSADDRQRLMLAYHQANLKGLDLAALVEQGKPKPVAGPTLGAVVLELVAAKESAGRSADYVKSLQSILNEFSQGRAQVRIADVSLSDVAGFLDSHEPPSRTTLRARLSTMFNFAIRRGHCTANPCARIEPQTHRKPPPAVFTPADVSRCLAWLSAGG